MLSISFHLIVFGNYNRNTLNMLICCYPILIGWGRPNTVLATSTCWEAQVSVLGQEHLLHDLTRSSYYMTPTLEDIMYASRRDDTLHHLHTGLRHPQSYKIRGPFSCNSPEALYRGILSIKMSQHMCHKRCFIKPCKSVIWSIFLCTWESRTLCNAKEYSTTT